MRAPTPWNDAGGCQKRGWKEKSRGVWFKIDVVVKVQLAERHTTAGGLVNRCTLANSWWCGIDPPPESATGAFALSSPCSRAFVSPFFLAFFFDSSSSCCLGGNGSFHRGHPLFASVFQLSSSKDFSRERIVTLLSIVSSKMYPFI